MSIRSIRPQPHQVVITIAFALIIAGYALMAAKYPIAYIWATYEDLIGEWSQTYFFFSAMILSILTAVQQTRYRWFFSVLALACCYVVLEEISWGQRIFGFETPDFLKSRNLQGEANVHNLFTGPYKTLLKDSLSIAVAAGLVGYGLVYPLAHRLKWRLAIWADKMGVAAPPIVLWPFFCVAGIFELKPLSFNEAEIAELLVAIGLSITALHYLLAAKNRTLVTGDFAWSQNHSLRVGRWTIVLLVSVIAAAGLTTISLYTSPRNHAAIDGRIERGVEKFAGRYVSHNRCDIAIDLYSRLLRKEPDRVSVIRRVASCYRELGRTDMFASSIAKAIEIDLSKHAIEPWRASVNRSLVRSYRLGGDIVNADHYLAQAMEIGFERISKRPDSASAAYSLGQTLMLADRTADALEQFTKAYESKPSTSKYRKAYFAARRKQP